MGDFGHKTKPYDTNAGNLPVSSSSYTNEFAATSNKVTVLCPKCNTNVEQIVEGIQLNQTKPIIAKVYHYFEQEYEELKEIYKDLDLTPLSKFTKRTALATGVSETTVLQILNEEEQWNAAHKEEPPQKRRRVPKRPRETDSSHEEEEDSSDDNDNDDEHPGNVDEPQSDPELETLQVKIEPPDEDCDKVSPDPLAVKVEPRDDEQNNSNKTVARNEPGSSTLKGKTKQRPKDTHLKHYSEQAGSSLEVEVKLEPRDDEPDISNNTLARNEPGSSTLKGKTKQRPKVVALRQQLRQGGSSTAEYTSNVPANEEFDESSLLGARGVKMEIEIDEEGFS